MPDHEFPLFWLASRALRLMLLGSIIVLTLAWSGALTVAPAQAAHLAQTPGASGPIIGLWTVHPYPDQPAAQELTAFTSDGLMLVTNAPSMPAMPGEAPGGATQLFASQGYGVWTPQGDRGAAFKFLAVTYDPDGNYVNTVSIHGTLTVDPSGDALSGTYAVTIMLPDGTSMDVQGLTPVTGTRVTAGAVSETRTA
jgi:hypothetical protein